MPPNPWTCADQLTFLQARLPDFKSHQLSRTLKASFWPSLENDWFAAFPEATALFGPDAPARTEMTPEQLEELGTAIFNRKKVRFYLWISIGAK